jgi:putative aldouronate transport system permease protein
VKKQKILSDKILETTIYIFVTVFCISTLMPFWNALVVSIQSPATIGMGFKMWPDLVDFGAWTAILKSEFMWKSFNNTVTRTVLGTVISVILVIITAYPISKKRLPFRKVFLGIICFTMFFGGGLIPTFLLVKNLGLMNTIWALVLPGAITPFNVILMKNFFSSLPPSLEESAKIDGANDIYILYKIVVPLSMPIIATISLWVMVSNWNAWFDVVLYINDRSKYVLQMVLRELIGQTNFDPNMINLNTSSAIPPTTDSIRAASTLFVVIPILMVYPFLQKYFVKGIMIGSIKE